jgi:hypothetical protein
MTRALAVFAIALLTGAAAPLSSPAQTSPAPEASWEVTLPSALATELSSPDANRRVHATIQVIRYGQMDDGTIRWAPVVAPLLTIFETDPAPRARQLAVAALHAIETPAGMSGLRRLAPSETAGPVLVSAIDALVDYYGLEAFAGDRDMARLAEQARDRDRTAPATLGDAAGH